MASFNRKICVSFEEFQLATTDMSILISNSYLLFHILSGLSKEGWSITKNLCTELTIVVFGFFTFVPAIQVRSYFKVEGIWMYLFIYLFILSLPRVASSVTCTDLQEGPALQ